MAINSTTPNHRIARLLDEGARILAVHSSQPGIDITYDIIALLEAANGNQEPSKSGVASEVVVAGK